MAIYSYKGIDHTGKELKSTITSENISQAKQKIKSMGIMLLDIKEQKTDALKQQSTITIVKQISVADLALMTRQLATLIRAKVPLVEALSALTDQMENPQMRVVLAEIKKKVNEGSSLAKAFGDYPKFFDNVYINMVDAGEASGNLDIVLLRLADFTEGQLKLKNKIKGAMFYPVVMMIFGAIMMGVIFTFVIPKITKIFVSMKKELPTMTKISIAISEYLREFWLPSIIAVVAIYYLFKRYIQTKKGKAKWHRFLLRLPIVGELVTMINVSRFCSTLATLLNSGVPILVSMRIVSNLVSNVHMKQAIEVAKESVSEGASMATPLAKSQLFPAMVTHMITIGERSGELEPMLKIIAENYEEEVDARLSGLTSVLEPIMMIVMGLAVAFIVFSVIMPMMEMSSIN